MNYTLHQLQVFVKVVQTLSVTKASEELFMTQPAVSIQLKNFQDQFEIPLTEVIGRRLHVTDFGHEIYIMAERILNEVYAINYKTNQYKGLLSGRLKVGVVSTGKYVMPFLLSKFINHNDGIDLVMDVTNKSRVIESLAKGEIEFALVSVLPDKLDIEEEVIMDNELQFIANKDFKYNNAKFTKEDLEKQALLYREEGSATRKIMEDFFQKKNLRIRKKIELTTNEAVKQAVLAGLGISIMPVIGIRSDLQAGRLKILPSAGMPIKTKWRLIWLKNKQLSPVALAYLTYLRDHKSDIIKKYF
jgi:DNA-binding transcriptional LysR family regulator